MAKLYFRHGAVGSAKTLNLLAVAHNYRQQGKEVILLKPFLDDRFGVSSIKSRAGLEKIADFLVKPETNLLRELNFSGVSCILVDEAQFLDPDKIDQLRHITLEKQIPVICYGLRTDFKQELFAATKRLMELADSIEEVKTTCAFCNAKAVFNIRHRNGCASLDGPVVELGADEKYFPACHACYTEQLQKSGVSLSTSVAAD